MAKFSWEIKWLINIERNHFLNSKRKDIHHQNKKNGGQRATLTEARVCKNRFGEKIINFHPIMDMFSAGTNKIYEMITETQLLQKRIKKMQVDGIKSFLETNL